MLTIGELSRETGIKVPTIRYYEQKGLLKTPVRTEGNQRRYEPSDLQRLRFIRHARELGLTMEAVTELLQLNENPQLSCHKAHEIACAHLASVRQRISQLMLLEKELSEITQACHENTMAECRIIKSLADFSHCHADHGQGAYSNKK
ncbi:MerR family transcriptional regulator [Polycladidibacter stylochi]|uniref:MerR family transcriptional regulator n=1 Tax=Polycladidibacter stylochi TaxID=1807766 RepID=UPI0008340D28|nr:helix-turn-helix domain-containing protein [Pseudovibrio stylochi]